MAEPHRFHPSILREYDIRGIVGETLGEADAFALGQVFATMAARETGRHILVGRDGRESSPSLEAALAAGLAAAGARVERIGLGPTPMLYYAVHARGGDGGIMVTGSHNPPDYNGFKMMIGTASVHGERIRELGDMAARGDSESGPGTIAECEVFEDYIARLAQDFDGAPLAVGWDPGNGAAGLATQALARRLPGRHIVINGEIDGRFPNHHPDPTVEANLAQLKDLVRREGLDLGVAFDGDGDRIGAVDRHGRVVWGDQLLLILARDLLAELPGATIIADVKASQILFDGIAEAGGRPLMWKTGHSLIKSRMADARAPLAGEMSGHIFFAHRFYGHDDALYAAVRLLNALARAGDLADIRDGLPKVVNTPELRFPCPDERKRPVIEEVRVRLEAAGADVIAIDGVRVRSAAGWWLLRASNTQDVLVARVEAGDEAGLERLKSELKEQLSRSGIAPPADL